MHGKTEIEMRICLCINKVIKHADLFALACVGLRVAAGVYLLAGAGATIFPPA